MSKSTVTICAGWCHSFFKEGDEISAFYDIQETGIPFDIDVTKYEVIFLGAQGLTVAKEVKMLRDEIYGCLRCNSEDGKIRVTLFPNLEAVQTHYRRVIHLRPNSVYKGKRFQ